MPFSLGSYEEYASFYKLGNANGNSLCIEHCIDAINPESAHGRVGVIVPEGILFDKKFSKLREYIYNTCFVQNIISLPQGAFKPYTDVKTSILYLTKVKKNKTLQKKVWHFSVENDGFTMNNKRIKKEGENDLDIFLSYNSSDNKDLMLDVGFNLLDMKELKGNDFVSIPNVYKKFKFKSEANMVFLESLISESDERNFDDNSPVYSVSRDKGLVLASELFAERVASSDVRKYKIVKPHYFAYNPSRINIGSIALNHTSETCCVSPMYVVFKIKTKKVLPEYILCLMQSKVVKEQIQSLSYGSVRQTLTFNDFIKIKIPLYDLGVQRQIVDELDSYQQIIDAARVIVENYKPKLPNLSEYPLVELGRKDLFEIQSGGTPSSKNTIYWNGDINWITLKDLPPDDFISQIKHTERKITQEGLQNSSAKLLPINSVVVSSRATIGRVGITKIELATNQGFKNVIIKNQDFISPCFLAYSLKEKSKTMLEMASGATFKEISKTNFERITINVPPLEVQNQIIAQIESEQALIEPSKKLIEVFTKKINDRINQLFT